MDRLKEVIESYMSEVPEVIECCNRCLNVERYGGDVVLMIVDASFVSIGLNYFNAVIPKVFEFRERFVDSGKIRALKDLAKHDTDELTQIWKNRRSWNTAKEIASYLSKIDRDDRIALIKWAKNSSLEKWKKDPVGRIKGVGINTYQYLRMMGGVDTVMPDKIVKKVFREISEKAGIEVPDDNVEFVKKIEEIGKLTGYRPIELCWMTWLVQYEGDEMRIRKYAEIMKKI
ncbi:MAG TPA: hypothetical protein EYP30_01310 [Archaeoglobaceae archaeon]|nr:hypothetical protein [Archaeoglobaceae archaeon]